MEFEPDFTDTDPRALAVMIELEKKMPPGDKAALTLQMGGMLIDLAEAGVRAMYPQADEREVRVRLALRHLDRALVLRAYGCCPDDAKPGGAA
jgi:hypothetical protein